MTITQEFFSSLLTRDHRVVDTRSINNLYTHETLIIKMKCQALYYWGVAAFRTNICFKHLLKTFSSVE